jgi:hypothetical protein
MGQRAVTDARTFEIHRAAAEVVLRPQLLECFNNVGLQLTWKRVVAKRPCVSLEVTHRLLNVVEPRYSGLCGRADISKTTLNSSLLQKIGANALPYLTELGINEVDASLSYGHISPVGIQSTRWASRGRPTSYRGSTLPISICICICIFRGLPGI